MRKYNSMKVVVRCTVNQQNEVLQKATANNASFNFMNSSFVEFINSTGNVFIDLVDDAIDNSANNSTNLFFKNAVIKTFNQLPKNCIRINGWAGFIQREIIEIATPTHEKYVAEIMQLLGWKYQLVQDSCGMIAPRIIAMIVNEAYFGLEDNISTKNEIDIAMKLGTNYPYGPFEWSEKIGLHNIYQLLINLSKQDKRYTPANLLATEATKKI